MKAPLPPSIKGKAPFTPDLPTPDLRAPDIRTPDVRARRSPASHKWNFRHESTSGPEHPTTAM